MVRHLGEKKKTLLDKAVNEQCRTGPAGDE